MATHPTPARGLDDLAGRLTAALGPLAVHPAGESGRLLVVPEGREGVRRSVELLAAQRATWVPRGGGRRPAREGDVLVGSGGVARLFDLWREDFVCHAGAGLSLAALQGVLAAEGMRLAVDAPLPERATLGGVFASADRGLRGGAGQGLRDVVLGLTAVDGAGRLLKAGARVVKNVAGYDLARLHLGASGAFGMVLDLVLKLEPLPECRAARVEALDLATALRWLPKARRPGANLEPAVQAWLSAGAARRLGLGAVPGALVLVAEGWQEAVEAWCRHVGGSEAGDLPQRARDLGWGSDSEGPLLSWRVTASGVAELWSPLERDLESLGIAGELVVDLAGAGGTLHLPAAASDGVLTRLAKLAQATRRRGGSLHFDRRGGLDAHGGAAGGSAATPWSQAAQRLKLAFDPNGLLPPLPEEVA